ncbi:MAG: peptidylprolyl isomerase [SAR324 cluster bacterium]|jgi:peptidyl-prolyl cis-trans isomerase B (cyclophilin B)|nr:peptidylprolyl isomerase [Deltaproteobacteria bacterium]MDP6216258.1 peptidylprolyl isomerase [SAR324 cluster bacterium]MDC0224345.1 peptidylprolyl isomerase [Deltaproteobacteria bacterium]MDC0246396.1 peptidylprolyl isomerase [Deltaproteobacteria bacterium]MDP6320336.1 peptidylprolyl isomerase [SAR324 cluster bacterium]|tara:strand:+ start:4655 stop:5143 length:489 start_codon:yes stop_codon:yes gene_type:complete
MSDTKISEELPQIQIQTDRGDMTIEMFEDHAPNTVANMISLIEKGYYDGLNFHRVISDFMIQGGCPQGTGTGGPGYKFDDECTSECRHDSAGILSMANAGPRTNGSQFFITHGPTPHLDGKHTVFGKVTEGLDVVHEIKQGDVMEKVVVLQKRDHVYEVETI